jgi:outer membrane protein TolC
VEKASPRSESNRSHATQAHSSRKQSASSLVVLAESNVTPAQFGYQGGADELLDVVDVAEAPSRTQHRHDLYDLTSCTQQK